MKKTIIICTLIALNFVYMTAADDTPTVSASKVAFKYCEASYGSETIGVSTLPVVWNGETFTKAGTYVVTIPNHRGCDSIITLTINYKEGAIPFAFSVASNKQVYFSKGNLQYCAAPTSGETMHETQEGAAAGIWRFAENQYDFVGGIDTYASVNNGNVYVNGTRSDNIQMSSSYTGWLDYFRYGTSGSGAYQPISYYYYTAGIANTNYDWGKYNAISNGGNSPDIWRTMTAAEWTYLLSSRTNAAQKFSRGMVNNVIGLIILPDTWTLPEGCTFVPSELPKENKYNKEMWRKMEEHGAVFLPCSGHKVNNAQSRYMNTSFNQLINVGTAGYYWVSDAGTSSTYKSIYSGSATVTYYSRKHLYIGSSVKTVPSSTSTVTDLATTKINDSPNTNSNSSYIPLYEPYSNHYFLSVRLVCNAE